MLVTTIAAEKGLPNTGLLQSISIFINQLELAATKSFARFEMFQEKEFHLAPSTEWGIEADVEGWKQPMQSSCSPVIKNTKMQKYTNTQYDAEEGWKQLMQSSCSPVITLQVRVFSSHAVKPLLRSPRTLACLPAWPKKHLVFLQAWISPAFDPVFKDIVSDGKSASACVCVCVGYR